MTERFIEGESIYRDVSEEMNFVRYNIDLLGCAAI